jgi:putative peptidoglycan lipid II flippase
MSNLLVVLLFIEDDIILVAYSTLFSTSIAIVWQWYLIFKKHNIKYEFLFYKREISKEIYKNSFKINIGSILYGSKDIITAIIFTSYGSGMYTLFNYANRFAGVIVQVVNAPIINIFIVKISHIISKKYYSKIESLIQEVLLKTVSLFLIASMLLYIILPYLLTIFFDGKFSLSDMEIIQYIFVYLVIYYLIPTIESPFVSVVNLLKMFNYVLFINTVFFIFMAIGYAFFELFELDYEYFLIFLILSQLSNAWLYIKKYRIEVRKLVT